jgi:hypothetical protein
MSLPRYCLKDAQWLLGTDPLRRYWLCANEDPTQVAVIQGPAFEYFIHFRQMLVRLRGLVAGDFLELQTAGHPLQIDCLAPDCYAVSGTVRGAAATHLFDRKSLESLLLSAHPAWEGSPRDLLLGQTLLQNLWQASHVA